MNAETISITTPVAFQSKVGSADGFWGSKLSNGQLMKVH